MILKFNQQETMKINQRDRSEHFPKRDFARQQAQEREKSEALESPFERVQKFVHIANCTIRTSTRELPWIYPSTLSF